MNRLQALLDRERRRVILGALLLCRGNVTHAAARLGIQRTYLHRLLRRHYVDAGMIRDRR